ncbi:MAG: putative ABC transporter permease [Candidatus Magasanikbacteria bacterium]
MEDMRQSINKYIFIFLFGSFFGWILELIYRSLIDHHIVNPGFLSGPFLPIYGFGLVLLTLILNKKKLHWFYKILIFAILATLMECISGWFFQYFYHIRLWDYSDEWGNLNGWICPLFFSYWLVSGFLYYFFLSKAITKKVEHYKKSRTKLGIVYILTFLLFLDMTHSFYSAEEIGESWMMKHKKNFPVLSDYKIFQPDNATNFLNSIIESLKNYSNYKLPEKILKK